MSSSSVSFARIHRDVIRVSGPEAIGFLQGQLSQDIAALSVGDTTWSFALQPQGKVDSWFRLQRTADDAVVIDVDPGWGDATVARINRFKLRTKCDVALELGVPTIAVRGTELPGGLPCGWPATQGTDCLAVDDPSPELDPEAQEIDDDQYRALRIVNGFPAMGAELTEATIPAEAGQWVIDASVSFSKGCFTGQELVARIDSRGGNVPRHLRGFTTAEAPPEPGSNVVIGDDVMGTVTSSARRDDGTSVGLAYVKRSAELPVAASIGTAVAMVSELPLLQ